ncbi:MAG TPA: ABC transporter ATP-binding protein [Gaiellaceae bacterium]|nr:ABC transporter ATP-binding protein [Gaiellaceae bacterium]
MSARRAPGQEPFLDVVGLSAGYSRVPVVRDVSIEISLGEIVLVMGPNGAGKSTLVKSITGQLPLLDGRVALDGADVSKMREENRIARGLGYVPQTRDVFAPLTVLENLQMGGSRLPHRDVAARLQEVLELFPALAPLTRRTAKTLSGGERKMVAIARALMADPRLLILDEPTSNLAPLIAADVLEGIVARLAESGRAVLLIEQRVSLALQVASWGYVLTDGKVRLEGPAEELRSKSDLGALFLGRGGAEITPSEEHPAERSA